MTDAQGICQEPLSADDFTADQTVLLVKAFKANIRSAPGTDAEIIQTPSWATISSGPVSGLLGPGSTWVTGRPVSS